MHNYCFDAPPVPFLRPSACSTRHQPVPDRPYPEQRHGIIIWHQPIRRTHLLHPVTCHDLPVPASKFWSTTLTPMPGAPPTASASSYSTQAPRQKLTITGSIMSSRASHQTSSTSARTYQHQQHCLGTWDPALVNVSLVDTGLGGILVRALRA